jgi:hypothetical protein
MMARWWGSAGIGALASASLVLGLSLFAPTSARAQCTEAEDAAFSLLELIGEVGQAIDNDFGTNPSQQDCEKICKAGGKGCKKATSDILKATRNLFKAAEKVAKVLCKTAADPKACKADIKLEKKLEKEVEAQVKADFKAACEDVDIASACIDACNTGTFPACCEGAFGGLCP